jgi:hypothetical protein
MLLSKSYMNHSFFKKGLKFMRKIKTCKKFVRITLSASMAVITAMFKTAIPCHGWPVEGTTTPMIAKDPVSTIWYAIVEASTPPVHITPGSAQGWRGCLIISMQILRQGQQNATDDPEFADLKCPAIELLRDSGRCQVFNVERGVIVRCEPGMPFHARVHMQRLVGRASVKATFYLGIESTAVPVHSTDSSKLFYGKTLRV